jgi:hypothetical protein
MPEHAPLSLAGRTLQWRFDGGPTGDKTYEHTFRADGTVVYREVGTGEAKAAADGEGGTRYASFEVAPGMHLVSYLASSGFTLTVLVNQGARTVHGFASNEKSWFPLQGALVGER